MRYAFTKQVSTSIHYQSKRSYDQKHIDRIGKLKNCIAYGPGLLELAHKPDEYIGIDDMVDSACVMGAALETLLLPKSSPNTRSTDSVQTTARSTDSRALRQYC